MTKTKQEAAILIETFRNMTEAIHATANSESLNNASNNEENNDSILLSGNPFLINTIINRLFGFLPLKDVKRSRLVCREWCSTAGVCLRKRSAIKFAPNGLLPRTFMDVSKYSHPDLPFDSFVFAPGKSLRDRKDWKISEIQNFFEKWGKNIKEVTFNYITLTRECELNKKEVLIHLYNVTQLFLDPSNITSLIIRHARGLGQTTRFEISLEKFVSIKTLHLSDCTIIASPENQSTRIAPLNICFRNVSFKRNGSIVKRFPYNDILDFSKALNIHLELDEIISTTDIAKFDMGKHVLNSTQFHLIRVPVINWARAKGNVQFLSLDYIPFEEKNNLKIKQLKFAHSKIQLTALPETLEFLDLSDCIRIFCTEPLILPNLKYLYINVQYSDSLKYFSNCENLKELKILGSKSGGEPCKLSVGCIPSSVDTMRMKLSEIKFTDNSIFELDSLILERSRVLSSLAITAQIKAKVLVVDFFSAGVIDTLDIVKLVQTNNQSQKIIIDTSDFDLYENAPFEGSEFSNYVDNKSNAYQFEDGVGKSITHKEFERWFKEEAYFPRHFNWQAPLMMIAMEMMAF